MLAVSAGRWTFLVRPVRPRPRAARRAQDLDVEVAIFDHADESFLGIFVEKVVTFSPDQHVDAPELETMTLCLAHLGQVILDRGLALDACEQVEAFQGALAVLSWNRQCWNRRVSARQVAAHRMPAAVRLPNAVHHG